MKRIAMVIDVSRETEGRLDVLAAMLRRWNASVNLVAPSTIAHLSSRHVHDSVQIARFASSRTKKWVDLGAGGGFPGLVVAAQLHELQPQCRMVLIESDKRKSVFLREAARQMGISVEVIAQRVESTLPQGADIVSARALAPLPKLLEYTHLHLNPDGIAIFLKGVASTTEIAQACEKHWAFDLQTHPSQTDPQGVILELRNIHHART